MGRDRPGKIIAGRYELLEPAGEGGMAVVWRSLVRGAGAFARPVAVKRIHAAKGADQHFVSLFEEEARVGAALQHPNVVQIMDFGVDDDGDYFLVMEWVEGTDLHHWVRAHPRGMELTPWPLVVSMGIQVLHALGAAHERVDERGAISPVIHRDVSPSNIMLGTNGTVKLTDFGLARAMDRASMTRPNVIKGKLAYCAPELITGQKASGQSDLFALGVVLWETLAQQRLFTGKNDLEVLLSVRKGEVQRLSELRTDIPAAVDLAIHQALAPNPENRFESANSMARALAAILRGYPEPVDAESLGASVRDALERLGLGRKAAAPAAGPVMSVQDLSLSDVEVFDEVAKDVSGGGGMSVELDIDVSVSEVPSPGPVGSVSAPMRGLWSDKPAGNDDDDVSVSFELVRPKKL